MRVEDREGAGTGATGLFAVLLTYLLCTAVRENNRGGDVDGEVYYTQAKADRQSLERNGTCLTFPYMLRRLTSLLPRVGW